MSTRALVIDDAASRECVSRGRSRGRETGRGGAHDTTRELVRVGVEESLVAAIYGHVL